MNGNTEQISTPPSLHFDLGETGRGGHRHTTSAWIVLLSAAEGRKDGETLGISKRSSLLPSGTFVLGPERAFCYMERPTIDKVLQRA